MAETAPSNVDPVQDAANAVRRMAPGTWYWLTLTVFSVAAIIATGAGTWLVVVHRVDQLDVAFDKHAERLAKIEDTGIVATGEANRFKNVESKIELDVHNAMKPVLEDFKDPIEDNVTRLETEVATIKDDYVTKAHLEAQANAISRDTVKVVNQLGSTLQADIATLRNDMQKNISELQISLERRFHKFDKELAALRRVSNQISMRSSLDIYAKYALVVEDGGEEGKNKTVHIAYCDLSNRFMSVFAVSKSPDELLAELRQQLEPNARSFADVAQRSSLIAETDAVTTTVGGDPAHGFSGFLGTLQFSNSFVFSESNPTIEKICRGAADTGKHVELPPEIDTVGKLIGAAEQRHEVWKAWFSDGI